MNTEKKNRAIPEISPALERGPVWLRNKQKLALAQYNQTPLPPRGLHLWRYTDPAAFQTDNPDTLDTPFDENYDAVVRTELSHLEEHRITALVVDYGGREIHAFGLEHLPDGVIVSSLSDAVENHQELVEPYLYRLVNSDSGKFEALNGALWNDGVFVYLPDNAVIEKPIHLLRESGLQGSTHYPRLLVVAGHNTELTLIDEYSGGSTDYHNGFSQTNGVAEIFGLENSRVRYVTVQRQGMGARSYLTQRAQIDRGASMLTIPLAFGGALSKQNFGVRLHGEGADSRMYGLLFGTGRQHFDNHTLHHHEHNNTTSMIDFKVVLRDRALSAYTGLIRIEESAPFCEAYQTNRNLLLSEGTRAETIPELEILNEEVSCSHGATVGPIDPQQIFYLNCRGIDHDEAVRMIVSGFVAQTLTLVPDDLRERLSSFVESRLKEM